jgi:hypothetical protein
LPFGKIERSSFHCGYSHDEVYVMSVKLFWNKIVFKNWRPLHPTVRKPMGLRHWQCRDSSDSDILCSKRQQSGKDSVIEGQSLLLFM